MLAGALLMLEGENLGRVTSKKKARQWNKGTRQDESSCEDAQQFDVLLLDIPEIYNSARKHFTFFGGG